MRSIPLGKQEMLPQQSSHPTTKKILFIGDSVVLGIGASSPLSSLSGLLAQEYPNYAITVRGKVGIGVEETLSLLYKESTHYDAILIFCGGMDIIRMKVLKKNFTAYHQLFLQAKTRAHDVIYIGPPNVGHSTLFLWCTSWWYRILSKKHHFAMENVTQQHGVIHIPLYSTHDLFFNYSTKLYASDMSHPNDNGYQIWFTHINKYLKELLH